MLKLFFFAFVYIFGCLLNQEWSIRAQETLVKRVQGGKDSVNERFFYINMTSYFTDVRTDKSVKLECGAMWYTKTIVLSAGHCVFKPMNIFQEAVLAFQDYRISLAEITAMKGTKRIQTHLVTVPPHHVFLFDDIRYQQENGNMYVPDLAFLEMGPNDYEQLTTAFILPICSANFFREIRVSGKQVSVVGLGLLEYNSQREPSVLQEATMKVTRTQNPCKYYYEQGKYIDQDILCAVGVSCFRFKGSPRKLAYNNRKHTCSGDSGGPLFHKYKNGTAHCLIGIVGGTLRPVSGGNKTLIEKLSPFHDGSGRASYFTSLERFQQMLTEKPTWFLNMQLLNDYLTSNPLE